MINRQDDGPIGLNAGSNLLLAQSRGKRNEAIHTIL